jgi:DNA-binding MarR family transcriptional regulator
MAAVNATAATASPRLSVDEADAWFGVLNAQTALVRAVDAELLAAHRLSCSSHEILYRLANADQGHLSIGALGAAVAISPSRVSRVVDEMSTLGLVERVACATDARVSHVVITDNGRAALPEIERTFQSAVRRHFLDRLTPTQVRQLATIMRRLGTPAECVE